MTNKKLNNRLQKLLELEAQKKELDRKISAIKSEIKTDMGDEIEVKTDKFIVKNTPYNSNHFDSNSFRVNHERLYQKFVTVTQTTRFSYKEI